MPRELSSSSWRLSRRGVIASRFDGVASQTRAQSRLDQCFGRSYHRTRHRATAGHELYTNDPSIDACRLDRRRTAGPPWSLPCESVRPPPWRPIISGRNLNQSVSLNDVPAAESCRCCQFRRRSRRLTLYPDSSVRPRRTCHSELHRCHASGTLRALFDNPRPIP